VEHVQQKLGVSERRACKVIGQARASQRYVSSKPVKDRALRRRMHKLAARHKRYGYRRVWALLRQEGWAVNRKRVQRLWREEGLRVPQRQRKRRRLGTSANGTQRLRAAHGNHVWSYDFVMDQTVDGRRLKLLPIVDEFTREAHGILVDRSITAEGVVAVLKYLFSVHGEPEFIRSDNGPEFIATAVREWLQQSGVRTLYIEPGSPWENAYSESFNSRFRDELLNQELFTGLTEARVLVEQYRVEYNHLRPHSSLGYMAPAVFAARQHAPDSASVACAPDGATAFDHTRLEGRDEDITMLATLS
jgi:putative transposase